MKKSFITNCKKCDSTNIKVSHTWATFSGGGMPMSQDVRMIGAECNKCHHMSYSHTDESGTVEKWSILEVLFTKYHSYPVRKSIKWDEELYLIAVEKQALYRELEQAHNIALRKRTLPNLKLKMGETFEEYSERWFAKHDELLEIEKKAEESRIFKLEQPEAYERATGLSK